MAPVRIAVAADAADHQAASAAGTRGAVETAESSFIGRRVAPTENHHDTLLARGLHVD